MRCDCPGCLVAVESVRLRRADRASPVGVSRCEPGFLRWFGDSAGHDMSVYDINHGFFWAVLSEGRQIRRPDGKHSALVFKNPRCCNGRSHANAKISSGARFEAQTPHGSRWRCSVQHVARTEPSEGVRCSWPPEKKLQMIRASCSCRFLCRPGA